VILKMRKIRWQLLIAVGGILLIILLLIGQTPDLEVSSAQPARGGVFIEASIGELIRLNPILDTFNQTDRDIDRLLFRGLVAFDARGNVIPDLAESWAVSADATVYTFTIREDAVWHDGTPVTADDVIYTFSKLQDEDYPGPADLHDMWSQINIIRLDDRILQFQLPEPFAPFLDYLSLGLLPDHILRGVSASDLIDHPFNLEPIGTGPFQFDRYLTDEEGNIEGISLLANEDYYNDPPYLERFEIQFFASAQEALEAFEAGQVNGIAGFGEDILAQVLDDPNLSLFTSRLPEVTLVFLNIQNQENTVIAEKSFRQALMMATNREWLINQILDGQGIIPHGPIFPGTWAHASELPTISFDQAAAMELLDDLGYELPAGATPGTEEYVRSRDGELLEIELTYPDSEPYSLLATLLQQSWQAIGIRVSLRAVPAESLMSDVLTPRAFEAVLTEIDLSRYPDPDPYPFWHDSQTETGQNYSGFDDRNSSIWLEQARITPDVLRRAELYRSFQYRFQDQVPALLLYYPVYSYAVDARLNGITIGPLLDPSDRLSSVTDWYLIARRTADVEPSPTP